MALNTQAIFDALPECILLVEFDATIIGANSAAGRALTRDPVALAGQRLYELIADPENRVPVYLRRCGASLQPIPGALWVRLADGSLMEFRVEGARIRLDDGSLGPIMLRCRPKREAVTQFTILNEKITELTREIVVRRAAEEALRESERQFRIMVDRTRHWPGWRGRTAGSSGTTGAGNSTPAPPRNRWKAGAGNRYMTGEAAGRPGRWRHAIAAGRARRNGVPDARR